MNKFSFVILHYSTIEDTIECVNSIKDNIKYNNYSIIIVDNKSPNNSGKELEKIYYNNDNIKVILNEENLGFAKGNNVGFLYAKRIERSDFICMINNDTLIYDEFFCEKIIKNFKETKFDVLGPDIISTKDNLHQNPVKEIVSGKKLTLIKLILISIMQIILNFILLDNLFNRIIEGLRRIKKKNIKLERDKSVKEGANVKLHGSCYIFSNKFIKKYDGLFDKTFMYLEEDILFYIINRDKLKSIYDNTIVIYHKEDSATDSIYINSNSKRRFIYRNTLKSAIEFYKLISK